MNYDYFRLLRDCRDRDKAAWEASRGGPGEEEASALLSASAYAEVEEAENWCEDAQRELERAILSDLPPDLPNLHRAEEEMSKAAAALSEAKREYARFLDTMPEEVE